MKIRTLFGNGSITVVTEPESLLRKPLVARRPTKEYIEASERLHINEIPLQMAALEAVLEEQGIVVFDYQHVQAYLDKQCEELTEKARKKDRFASRFEWSWMPCERNYDCRRPSAHVSMARYNEPIPPPVLDTIEQIKIACPAAQFFVSKIQQVADPFLAVTVEGSDTFHVIERWDEPSFRGWYVNIHADYRPHSEASKILTGTHSMFQLPPPAYENAPYSENCLVFRRDEHGNVYTNAKPARYNYDTGSWQEWSSISLLKELTFEPTHWKKI